MVARLVDGQVDAVGLVLSSNGGIGTDTYLVVAALSDIERLNSAFAVVLVGESNSVGNLKLIAGVDSHPIENIDDGVKNEVQLGNLVAACIVLAGDILDAVIDIDVEAVG